MENILEQVIKYYKNYIKLTSKQNKLMAVREAVEIIKDQLGRDIDNIRIRWVPEKGEAEAIINLWTNSKIGNLIDEIWEYLYPNYTVENISVIVTTFDVSEDIKPIANEKAELIFGTSILSEKTDYMKYTSYILIDKDVINGVTVYIYLVVEDREFQDDC